MKLELTPRLALLASWVPPGARLIDVGTDHGYLPAWLIQNGRIEEALASDLRPGPLSRAEDTARRCGVEYYEIAHLFSQWGAKYAPQICLTTEHGFERLFGWDTEALGEEYTGFVRAYLQMQ